MREEGYDYSHVPMRELQEAYTETHAALRDAIENRDDEVLELTAKFDVISKELMARRVGASSAPTEPAATGENKTEKEV